ncbi:unnamed protein product [Rotaria magnacalcarata]|uniref:Hydroxymethylglutaryl-coenzyme A synthase N-terminal domain-containing protein n=1 Tax=Rotaria magnacalcarata TaxID=392030 RepID=A0A819TRW6_9BILA|nr:unnamed protein product [Rotaria magnacalcarata]CAF3879381.1 unnamed protein product [Rotaria magnacalcarata]CAF3894624.1 unnamed protein product [Rotaria magnacalcarata]CAF4082104.1 unnamed protein product [Rotaria magnacalcarata]
MRTRTTTINPDISSLCLIVQSRLLDETGVHPQQIGRLDVGTETLVDKAKSITTVLMQLLVEHGNTAVESVDNMNACYVQCASRSY